MNAFPRRSGLFLALLLSGGLWLGISSVVAGAVHVFAKSDFSLRPFGSVSVGVLVCSIAWSLLVGYFLNAKILFELKALVLGAVLINAWVIALIALTCVADEILGRLGAAAIVIWIFEFTIAFLIFRLVNHSRLSDTGPRNFMVSMMATFAGLILAKALLLCLTPGVIVGLIDF